LGREQEWTPLLGAANAWYTQVCMKQSVYYWIMLINNVITVKYVCV
jgi:hypothetical protein